MDFDIDAVLDQLEKTLNQSDLEEKESNPIIQTSPPTSTSRKSVDELLLLDLDPFGSVENHNNNNEENDEDKLERFKQDLQELYASSTMIDPPSISTTTLPDIIGQQEELLTTTLPLAVEQLELEVRQEILQHTLEQPSSPLLLPDLTTLSNVNHDDQNETDLLSTSLEEEKEEEENLSSLPVIETTQTSSNFIFPKEPDLIQHETPVVIHSVDSIVNLPNVSDLEDFMAPNPSVVDIEPLQSSSSELVFIACDDNDQESSEEEPIPNSPPPSPSTIIPTTTPTQDFDLVKNILSEIFDKSDEEILDENPIEEKESELINIEQQEISSPPSPPPVTTNNDEDFRFLEEMLASIDVPDTDIHQLTPAEIDRVDSLLKEIVNSQQTEEAPLPSTINEIEPPSSSTEQPPPPPPSSIESSLVPSLPLEAAAAVPVDEELIRVEHEWSKLTEEEKRLGSVAPEWISDDLAPACMKCTAKFSITRRRHHCRACGKVFCSTCCWQKVKLIHDDSKEDRACIDCVKTINNVEYLWTYMRNNQKPRSSVLRKKSGTIVSASEASSITRQGFEHKKSVTFDDGIRPGVETTASSAAAVAATNIMSSNKIRSNENDTDQQTLFKTETLTTEELEERIRRLKDPNEPPIEFRIHSNLIVISKIIDNFDCYLTRNGGHCWMFSTRGLCTVAQDELIFIFEENLNNANDLISDILIHIHQIYIDATKGSFVRHLGISQSSTFLGLSTGFLYVSDPTSTYDLFPDAPYLFGVLIHQVEFPTAQCFPIRLLLRLGYEYQSYPWPLFSIVNRDAMFNDTQHTIMSLLCDFRSFTYILPTIRGLIISVGIQGSVSIRIPRNRHDDILKSLEQSSPHALSFGIMNINPQIHSKHLITIQTSTDQQYETRIFSSSNSNNEQNMIGGNFLVINASLRSRDSPSNSPSDTQNSGSFSSNNNLNAKVNTIEDGIMLQIDGDVLKILKQSLRERKDYAILAKARSILTEDLTNGNILKRNSSEQLVEFLWVDDDNDINRGVRSPIDHFPMDGIRNSRIHYAGQRSPLFRLRWTDLFFVECYLNNNESFDPTRLADSLAKAFIQALTPFIDMLVEAKYRKLGLRVTIDRENASYIAGANGEQLPPYFLSQLDDHMIPIVMKASDNVSRAAPSLVLELIFYLLD